MNWEFLRSDEMAEAIEKSGGLCVLPLGCSEKHGPHMPVGTDGLQGKFTCEMAAELEYAVVFPTGFWLGDMVAVHGKGEKSTNKGAISLNPHTLLTVLEELCDEIARNGFRKILIVNAHGGNKPLLDFFLRAQGYKNKNYATMVTFICDKVSHKAQEAYPYFLEHRAEYPMLTDQDLEVLKDYASRPDGFGGGHADFSECSWMMGQYPHLIAEDRYDLESGRSTKRGQYLTDLGVTCFGGYNAKFPNAFDGYAPHGCSQTIGQAMNLYNARRLAHIFKVLKEDEECVKIATGQK